MPITLYYLTFSIIPSQKANSIQVMQMCQAFSSLVDELLLFCRQGRTEINDIYEYYGIIECFQVHSVSVPKIRIFDKLYFAFVIISQLRKRKTAAIIYSRDIFVTGVLCFLRSEPQTIALEVHAPPPNRLWRWWMKRTLYSGRLSYIVAISEALASEFTNLFPDFPTSKILVAHDGASDISELHADDLVDPEFNRKKRHKIGYVGSLRPGKGMELIHQLAALMPENEFHVVGGDDHAVRTWTNKANHPNLIFHGFISPSKTDECIAQFDILLAPYQPVVLVGNDDVNISQWMSPLKIFEYMKSGKPIIASNLPVLREVLEHGRNALLAEATDPNQWLDNIGRLLIDDQLRIAICRNAYEDFRDNYTWERRAKFIFENINTGNQNCDTH